MQTRIEQLHVEITKGNLPEVKKLIDGGLFSRKLDINKSLLQGGISPLHTATKYGQVDIVFFLLKECNADANAIDDLGATPLDEAIKFLATEDSALNYLSHLPEFSPFLLVDNLIHKGARINTRGPNSWRQNFSLLSTKNGRKIVSFLVHYKWAEPADIDFINNTGLTFLHQAAIMGDITIIRFLVEECNACVALKCTAKNSEEKSLPSGPPLTAYDMAKSEGAKKLLKKYMLLSQHNTKISRDNTTNSTKKDPSLYEIMPMKASLLYYNIQSSNLAGVKDVVQGEKSYVKLDINSPIYPSGFPPLFIAAKYGFLDIMRYLIEECRANLFYFSNEKNITLTGETLFSENLEAIKYAVSLECNPSVMRYGAWRSNDSLLKSPKFKEIISFLLNAGKIDINDFDSESLTFLHRASILGLTDIVIFLIEVCGADASIRCTARLPDEPKRQRSYRTAYDLANDEVKKILLKYMSVPSPTSSYDFSKKDIVTNKSVGRAHNFPSLPVIKGKKTEALPKPLPINMPSNENNCINPPSSVNEKSNQKNTASSFKFWEIHPKTKSSVAVNSNQSEFHLLSAEEEDIQKVLKEYQHHPVPGKEIAEVKIIYNPALEEGFKYILKTFQARHENASFKPKWAEENTTQEQKAQREQVHNLWLSMAKPYTDTDYPNVKILPGWHGTKKGSLESIFRVGYAPLQTTDNNWFGVGIYSTDAAEYAYRVYAKEPNSGALILNYTISYSARPIIKGDNLAGQPFDARYDTHIVPVAPLDEENENTTCYYPCDSKQQHKYIEIVSAQGAQCLPRYLVRLKPNALHTLTVNLKVDESHKEKSKSDNSVMSPISFSVLTKPKQIMYGSENKLNLYSFHAKPNEQPSSVMQSSIHQTKN